MSGFGGIPHGGAEYGGIESPFIPPVPVTILIQPKTTLAGQSILVASTEGVIVDTSRNSSFLVGIDGLQWNTTATGLAIMSIDDGLSVELKEDAGGSSATLTSISDYISGDISVEYDIMSDYLGDVATQEIVYVGLKMVFTTGETLTIKRKTHSGFNGQQIQVVYTIGGIFYGGTTFQTEQKSGKIRLIKHGNIIAAVKDDDLQPIFYAQVNAIANFNVSVFSTTSGQSKYTKTRYKNYRSDTGIMFGSVPMINILSATPQRVLGMTPESTVTGSVDVVSFNHYGETGIAPAGFSYPLVLGQALSSNGGIAGNIQNDTVIR